MVLKLILYKPDLNLQPIVTPDGLDITGVIKINFIEVYVCSGVFYFYCCFFCLLKPIFQGQKLQLQV